MAMPRIGTYVASVTAVLLALNACGTAGVSSEKPVAPAPTASDQPRMGNARFIIPTDELPELTRAALEGSGDAAVRIAFYHQMILLDSAAARRWWTIAAENGSYLAMYNLSVELSQRQGEENLIRAAYWARRVEKEGPETLAKRARERLKDMGVSDPD